LKSESQGLDAPSGRAAAGGEIGNRFGLLLLTTFFLTLLREGWEETLMEFEWDEEKAAFNETKHGVSFGEAATLFDDPFFLVFPAPAHSISEQRYLIIGESAEGRLLLAVYAERRDRVRLISAREATSKERRRYEEEKNRARE